MNKNNPFYHLLKKYQKKLIQEKQDIHDQSYLMIPLSPPPDHMVFHYDEQLLTFIEHHVTVFKELNEEFGFNSTYHYTIGFDSHLIHIFFHENGSFIAATIETKNNHEKKVLRHYDNLDLYFLHFIIEKQLKPLIAGLYHEHTRNIKEMQTNYLSELSQLKEYLYEESIDILQNLHSLNQLIKKGEELKLMSYDSGFIGNTLRYLKGCQKILTESNQLAKVKPKKTSVTVPTSSLIEDEFVWKSTLSQKDNTFTKESAHLKDLEDFEMAFQHYVEQWAIFASSAEDLPNKIQQFGMIGHDLLTTLSAKALTLTEAITNPNNEQKITLRKANLDVSLLHENYHQYGISLLLKCLESKIWPSEHVHHLKKFAGFLKNSHLENVIRQQNIIALEFLLDNGHFDINTVLIKGKNGIALSPLNTAFKYNNIQLFQSLLQHKASVMAYYGDLPLAHTLLQLGVTHPFYKCFMNYYDGAREGNPRLYRFLIKAIEEKLIHSDLSAQDRISLESAKEIYQLSMDGFVEQIKFSMQTKENICAIQGKINPLLPESFKKNVSQEYKIIYAELSEKSTELCSLLKKSHQAQKLRRCAGVYQKIRNILDSCSDENLPKLSESALIMSLNSKLKYVNASIDYLKLINKSTISKSEKAILQAAIMTLQENQEEVLQPQLSTTCSFFQNLSNQLFKNIEGLKGWEQQLHKLQEGPKDFAALESLASQLESDLEEMMLKSTLGNKR